MEVLLDEEHVSKTKATLRKEECDVDKRSATVSVGQLAYLRVVRAVQLLPQLKQEDPAEVSDNGRDDQHDGSEEPASIHEGLRQVEHSRDDEALGERHEGLEGSHLRHVLFFQLLLGPLQGSSRRRVHRKAFKRLQLNGFSVRSPVRS